MRTGIRVFVGVTDPIDPNVETPEPVRDRALTAVRYIPVEQLGTCDDACFSPYADDTSTSRDLAFAKIEARVRGHRTRLPGPRPVTAIGTAGEQRSGRPNGSLVTWTPRR